MPVSIKCPQCARGLRVPDELIGRKVKCPGCSTTFTAEAGAGAAPPPPAEEGGYEAPRRSAGSSDAAARVKAPAITMLCFGIFGILLSFCNIGVSVAALAGVTAGPPKGGGQEIDLSAMTNGPLGLIQGIFGLGVSGLIIFAALKMKNLESYGLAMTGSILAMLPILSPCCCLGLPFGIWALVVLMNQDVKAAFQ
jgi:predicted Zn finger-like uncharacterized protein